MAAGDAPINTFVFLDLETTGLKVHRCRITEISLIAVSRSALADDHPNRQQCPRVVDKLILCVDPGEDVPIEAAEITGLSRPLLQRNRRGLFNVTLAKLIKRFLKLQARPVCLVAHNGQRFDFPILARHFREVGVKIHKNLGLLCACTLRAFREQLMPVLQPGESRTLAYLHKKYVGGSTPALHSAEGDSQRLMQIVHHTAEDMLPWIEKNATRFTHEFGATAPSLLRASTSEIPNLTEMPKMKKSHSAPQ